MLKTRNDEIAKWRNGKMTWCETTLSEFIVIHVFVVPLKSAYFHVSFLVQSKNRAIKSRRKSSKVITRGVRRNNTYAFWCGKYCYCVYFASMIPWYSWTHFWCSATSRCQWPDLWWPFSMQRETSVLVKRLSNMPHPSQPLCFGLVV